MDAPGLGSGWGGGEEGKKPREWGVIKSAVGVADGLDMSTFAAMSEASALPILSPKFTEALLYAGELHGRQRRKGSGIPFLAHLLGVAAIVLEDGGDEAEGIAALLHDAVEDHPRAGATEKEIVERFGPRVHRIVMGCTEPDPHALERGHKGPWEERKLSYIAHLREARDGDLLRVATADKLPTRKLFP